MDLVLCALAPLAIFYCFAFLRGLTRGLHKAIVDDSDPEKAHRAVTIAESIIAIGLIAIWTTWSSLDSRLAQGVAFAFALLLIAELGYVLYLGLRTRRSR